MLVATGAGARSTRRARSRAASGTVPRHRQGLGLCVFFPRPWGADEVRKQAAAVFEGLPVTGHEQQQATGAARARLVRRRASAGSNPRSMNSFSSGAVQAATTEARNASVHDRPKRAWT